jgi:hypothetical protein
MRRVAWSMAIIVVATSACFARATQFDRYLEAEQWNEAAREFSLDSSLRNDEHALYRAGVLFSTPGRPTYDPARGRNLLSMLLSRFPESDYRADVRSRLLLLDDLVRAQQDGAARQRDLDARIAQLTREMRDLRLRTDSVTTHSDSLRALVTRLEAERRDRDEQIRLLRLELQKLKEIDLKPRRPPSE